MHMKEQRNPSDQRWRDETALSRFQLIAPLQDESLDPAKRIALRREIAEKSGLSEKTIKRYDDAYRKEGFEGLKPRCRDPHNSSNLPDDYEEILQEAIQLRREVPSRSVDKIITILEMEGRITPGTVKRSTLQRHMYQEGFGSTHMKTYRDARESSSKRFCKPHRMMLIQADIKVGPVLKDEKTGNKVQTYLSSAIDDHSRFVLFSRFYDSQEGVVVEDTFHNAILLYGKFDACYVDNGTQYTAGQLRMSLAKLSIRLSRAPLHSGKSKGKVEKFHQVVDGFLDEAKVKKIRTIDELNYYWNIYLQEYYHKKPHEGIREYYESLGVTVPPEGITPEQEFNRDTRALTYLDTTVVGEAFLHHEQRKVDKGACISFQGRKYETKSSLIGFTVEISYDPASPETITVYFPGMEPFTARPVRINEYCDPNQPIPEPFRQAEAETSRFLDVLEKKHEQEKKHRADGILFGGYRKDVNSDV